MLAANPDAVARIAGNLNAIRDRVAAACERVQRDPKSIRIVAVTKAVGLAEAAALIELGVEDLGENRVETAETKIAEIGKRTCWHMIGSIQRRKARRVVELFDRVDSVDRMNLAESLNDLAGQAGRRLPVLVQVNVSGEGQKHGFAPEAAPDAVAAIGALEHLDLEGLMTMAPVTDDPEQSRPLFRKLAKLAAELNLKTVSMGMTNDFEIAIEEGATEIRIGTALYK